MKPTDKMFVAISGILGSRLTVDNYRTMMKDIASVRGITSKDKMEIITEIMACLIELDK